jgi:hypothetical protein
MSSLKMNPKKVSRPAPTPQRSKAPAAPAKGGKSQPSKRPAGDGFETSHSKGKGHTQGGSTFDHGLGKARRPPVQVGVPVKKGPTTSLSSEVKGRLIRAADDIASRLDQLTRRQLHREIISTVRKLGLPTRAERREARTFLMRQIQTRAESGSGGSGNKHFGG